MAEYLDLPAKGGLNETNLLFNKNKISDEVASLSSMSSISNSSSIYNTVQKKNKKLINPSPFLIIILKLKRKKNPLALAIVVIIVIVIMKMVIEKNFFMK